MCINITGTRECCSSLKHTFREYFKSLKSDSIFFFHSFLDAFDVNSDNAGVSALETRLVQRVREVENQNIGLRKQLRYGNLCVNICLSLLIIGNVF